MKTRTTIRFETQPLTKCVEFTRLMDELCFPTEMWLSENDLQALITYGAESTSILLDGREIGQAITLPEQSAVNILHNIDPYFFPDNAGIYSYSESIIPEYQNRGYGALLLRELALRMQHQGYRYISAHVRTRFGWNRKRMQVLNVAEARPLTDFWEDPMEIVEYQRIHI